MLVYRVFVQRIGHRSLTRMISCLYMGFFWPIVVFLYGDFGPKMWTLQPNYNWPDLFVYGDFCPNLWRPQPNWPDMFVYGDLWTPLPDRRDMFVHDNFRSK